ncbi:hypothetical protein MMC18_007951 [Xylographa bjoerkii]|nr:hypothetical protein [Xylographa bjoerkii]
MIDVFMWDDYKLRPIRVAKITPPSVLADTEILLRVTQLGSSVLLAFHCRTPEEHLAAAQHREGTATPRNQENTGDRPKLRSFPKAAETASSRGRFTGHRHNQPEEAKQLRDEWSVGRILSPSTPASQTRLPRGQWGSTWPSSGTTASTPLSGEYSHSPRTYADPYLALPDWDCNNIGTVRMRADI